VQLAPEKFNTRNWGRVTQAGNWEKGYKVDCKPSLLFSSRIEKNITRKAPGALDPAVVMPPLRCKIYYGHPRYEP